MNQTLTREGAKIILHHLNCLNDDQIKALYHSWPDYHFEKLKLIELLKKWGE
jgi:hypothetical protein